MTSIEVQCGNHPQPWKIADFRRDSEGNWHEEAAITKQGRERQNGLRVRGQAAEGDGSDISMTIAWKAEGDQRPLHNTLIDGGDPVPSGAAGWVESLGTSQGTSSERAKPHRTVDLTCPRCKKAHRAASYQRQETALFTIFDELTEQGITKVSPELLHRYEALRAKRSSNGF